jgi:glycosyltransferase involved in cell wall biosynthesis
VDRVVPMPTVLHLLPHRGGGAETYIDGLEAIEGFAHRRVALSASRSPLLGPFSMAARSPRVLRGLSGADLLHVHGDMAALLSLPLLGRRPTVWTPQGLHLLRRARGVRRAAVERGLEQVAPRTVAVLCSSDDERLDLEAFLSEPTRGRLQVVPNGVELPVDPPPSDVTRRELGLADSTCAVLFLGQLEERKDPLTAARATIEARERGADVVLLVAGDGPLEKELRELEGPAVRLLGHRSDAPRLLAAADVFVLPSSREGLSFALLEAMSYGLPPVVADGAGNAEVVGKDGIVVPFGQARPLADVLERLAADEPERARRGAAALERVRSTYSLEPLRETVERVYREALTAPGRGAAAGPASGA